MASSFVPKKLRLVVDKEKNKVVFAEAGKDFVDLLFTFLALPMGTIVRLVDKYIQDPDPVGCFKNLYTSVGNMDKDHFLNEACKDMLLYPSSCEKQPERLNLDDIKVPKNYFMCPNWKTYSLPCCKVYCILPVRCSCGKFMEELLLVREGGCNEIFFSDKTSFIITENMKVGSASIAFTMKILREFGYNNFDNLEEMFVDVSHQQVISLLHSLFSSETPLTDAFLWKQVSLDVPRSLDMSNLSVQDGGGEAEPNEFLSLTAFVSIHDMKVLFIECDKDFVDLLFTFLALPLKSAWGISGISLGCIANLCESFQSLSSYQGRIAMTKNCLLPWYYSCQKPLLDVCYSEHDMEVESANGQSCKPIDPRSGKVVGYEACSGFVKRPGTTYRVLDDLSVTPTDLSSIFWSLKESNIGSDDVEEQVINIRKSEAIRLLRASFMTSSAALTAAFGSFLRKTPKE